MPSQAAAEATRALLERVVEIGARRLQRRRQAEDQTGRERDDHRERKHGAVDADLLNVRQVEPAQRAKDAGAPEREQQPQRAAEQREQRAFGQQLADQAKPSGAESGADGDLTLARRRARQQQVRGVGAGDEQNESDRAEENQKGKLHVRDHMLVQADELDEALRSEQRDPRFRSLCRKKFPVFVSLPVLSRKRSCDQAALRRLWNVGSRGIRKRLRRGSWRVV